MAYKDSYGTYTSCPNCGGKLKERGKWAGCENWSRDGSGSCKTGYSVLSWKYRNALKSEIQDSASRSDKLPNEDQSRIVQWFENALKNFRENGDIGNQILAVNSDAGTGKSQVSVFLTWLTKFSGIYLVYGADNAKQMKLRTDFNHQNFDCRTIHSLGLMVLTRFIRVNVDAYYYFNFLNGQFEKEQKAAIYPILDILGKMKNTLMDCTYQNMEAIIERFGIEINKNTSLDFIWQWVNELYKMQLAKAKNSLGLGNADTLVYGNLSQVDFDDMIWLPVKLGLQFPTYPVILVDEMQDQNPCRMAIIDRIIGKNSIVVYVGDQKQAIMGFTGSQETLMSELSAQHDSEELTITYRNTTTILDFMRRYFPNVKTVSHAKNQTDTIATFASPDDFESLVDEHDEDVMVLCRNNAPLVSPCLSLIRQGKKARILGKDLGRILIGTMLHFADESGKYCNIQVVLANLNAHYQKRMEENAHKNSLTLLNDKIATIEALADGLKTVDDVINRINEIFTDDNGTSIIFSTCHKSKGKESKTVIVIQPELLTYNREDALKPVWETAENRLIYVLLTRPESHIFVLGNFGGIN